MLAVIAGRGGLPARVAGSMPARPLICVLEGFAPDGLKADIVFRLEKLGSLLDTLAARGVTEVCFCGGIDRPVLDPKAIDAATAPLVPIIAAAIQAGDDGALRAIMGIFEARGMRVRAAHDLAPDILAPAGVLSATAPDDKVRLDVERGLAVLQALAPLDVGQACVVGQGQVWAIETVSGTDHMLASLPDEVRAARASLIKGPKPGQDLRADLPTVGPATIDALHAAGLAALVVDAGKVILLEPEETLRRADAAGIVVWSRRPS
jgi:DUF1009 family protein